MRARVAATFVAFASLAALWLASSRGGNGRHGVLLLTPGTTAAFARDQIERHAPREVLALEGAEIRDDAKRIASVRAAVSALQSGEGLIIAGWGLLPGEWEEAAGAVTLFEPAPVPDGIASLEAPSQVVRGEAPRLRGHVRMAPTADSSRAYTLTLIGPGGNLDSLALPVDTVAPFDFAIDARAEGRFTWRLELRRGTTLVTAESLGIAVAPASPLRVLMLEQAPSFELNALAGWLGNAGAAVERRTAVSRGRVQITAVNRPLRSLARVDSATLATVDLAVLTDATWRALPRGEQSALERAVRLRGLGMALLADGDLSVPARRLVGATGRRVGDGARRRVRPVLDGGAALDDIEAAGVALEGGAIVGRDGQGRVLAAVYRVGSGAVAVSTLTGTDAWRRRGDDSTYARWWTALLDPVRAGNEQRDAWQVPLPIRVDHKEVLTLRTLDSAPVRRHTEPMTLADTLRFAQDPADRVTWRAVIWPRRAGWHTVEGPSGSRAFYVSERNAWKGLDAEARRSASARVARAQMSTARTDGASLPRHGLQLLLFATFVSATGYLWWVGRK